MRAHTPAILALALLAAALTTVDCAATRAAGTAARLAAPEPTWSAAGIDASETAPNTFTVRLKADMPTPGFTFAVDDVDVDADARRIVARVTERAPDGITSQVITPATLAIEVGPLAPGAWVFELRTRRDPAGPHVPRYARVLQAV